MGLLDPTTDRDIKYSRADSRRTDVWARLRERSAAITALTAASAVRLEEAWTDLAGWSTNTNVQVSGGRLFAATAGGGGGGIAKALPLGTTKTGLYITTVKQTSAFDGGSSGVMVGVSTGGAGTTPNGGGGDAKATWIRNDKTIKKMDSGTVTDLVTLPSNTPVGAIFLVIVSVGVKLLTITVVDSTGVEVTRSEWTNRSSINITNLFVYNNSTQLLNGHSVGAISGVTGSITKPTNNQGLGRTVVTEGSADGTMFAKLSLPANFDHRLQTPMVIQFHGNGSDKDVFADNAAQSATLNALLAAGYVVLSAHNANKGTWGSQAAIDTYAWALSWAATIVNLGPIALFANSMGSIDSLNALAQGALPGVVCWVGHAPTANLQTNYGNALFTSVIDTAYGITAGILSAATSVGATSISSSVSIPTGTSIIVDPQGATPETVTVTSVTGAGPYTLGVTALAAAHASGAIVSDYPTKTDGFNPATRPGRDLRGVPMLFLAATDDTTVPKSQNTDVLVPIVKPHSPDVRVVPGLTGGHSFAVTPALATQITNFVRQYVAA